MKRAYSKPEIMFESFSLSTNIAGDCEVRTNTPAQGVCAYTYEDEFGGTVTLFTSKVAACGDTEVSDEYGGICYHTFANNNLFNS